MNMDVMQLRNSVYMHIIQHSRCHPYAASRHLSAVLAHRVDTL